MDMNPLVTIIVPAYNHSKFIEECVQNVAKQTYTNIQLVVIDDASKDDTAEKIKYLADIYNFQYILNQVNQGHIKVINNALQNYAKGKYVCLLASDDFFPLDKIEQQVKIMESDDQISVCTGNAVCIDEGSRPILPISKSPFYKEREISFDELFRENTIPALTAMIRRDIYKKIGYYREDIITEDWYCWLRILSNGGKINHYNKIWGYYRVIETSLSKSNDERLLNAQIKVIESFKDHPLYNNVLQNLYNAMYDNKIHKALVSKDKKQALKELFKMKKINKKFLMHLKNIIIK